MKNETNNTKPAADTQFHVLMPAATKGKFTQCGITGNIAANFAPTSKAVFVGTLTGKKFTFRDGVLVEL